MSEAANQGSGEGQASQGNSSQPQAVSADTKFDTSMLPEAMRTEPYFKSFEGKTVGDVFKSGLEAHKTVGGSVRIPGEKATDDDWNNFYGKMRPATEKDYKVKLSDDIAKHVAPGTLEPMVKAMWESGLHPRQVNHIIKTWENVVGGHQKTLEQQIEHNRIDGEKAIKEKYKQNFEVASAQANRVAKRFGGEAFVQLIKDYNLSADPVFFDTFNNIAQAMHEDSWVTGNSPSKFLSKADAGKRVQEILNDRNHPYHNAGHPQHAAAALEVDELRKVQYAKD